MVAVVKRLCVPERIGCWRVRRSAVWLCPGGLSFGAEQKRNGQPVRTAASGVAEVIRIDYLGVNFPAFLCPKRRGSFFSRWHFA